VVHALKLLEEGADILDIGGESTRPGAKVESGKRREGVVSAQEELDRILPVIEGVLKQKPQAVISVDTYKSETARAAVAAGAEIVNDVSGFTWDPEMARTLAELRCGAVMMHTRGQPEEWSKLPPLEDPVGTVMREMGEAVAFALRTGISRESVVVDPGFGFGKRFSENYPLLSRFREFANLGFPLLAGPSRKSFIGRVVGKRLAEIAGTEAKDQPAPDRLFGTLAAVVACVLQGAHIVRVHDVAATVQAVAVADEMLRVGPRVQTNS
jgi:dihydropteroate synthase